MATTPGGDGTVVPSPTRRWRADLHPRGRSPSCLWEPDLCSIVWSVPAKRAEALCALDDERFSRQLTAAFDGRLGLCKGGGARSAIPLTARYARDFARERLVLVGDAAHTHPAGGAGVNLGLLDAAALAEQILKHHGAGRTSACSRTCAVRALAQRARRPACWRPWRGSSGCCRQQPLKKLVRGVGLCAVDALGPLKRGMIGPPWGWTGSCPPWPGVKNLILPRVLTVKLILWGSMPLVNVSL